jgi:hypothetical protein
MIYLFLELCYFCQKNDVVYLRIYFALQ